ncbi:hypothetical protein CHR56_37220 (plasmid) [Rhizobium leguminosarum bv. viciae]|nr:hypothetical protein CHR56_37220 [Rhizobium leguminosarum bv. viciae]
MIFSAGTSTAIKLPRQQNYRLHRSKAFRDGGGDNFGSGLANSALSIECDLTQSCHAWRSFMSSKQCGYPAPRMRRPFRCLAIALKIRAKPAD